MGSAKAARDVTVDHFLGGRISVLQPARGHHRSGLEAVLLGASMAADTTGMLVDLGAGVGVAGLCAASRCPRLQVTLVERESDLVAMASETLDLEANKAFRDRVSACQIDIAAPEAERIAAGLQREAADLVVSNPPFDAGGGGTASPEPARRRAHIRDTDLKEWFRAAAWLLKPAGAFVMIGRATSLPECLAAADGRFGSLTILPIHPRPGLAAERIMLRGVKGRSGPPRLLPGLVLHGAAGSAFSDSVDAVLRGRAGIGDILEAWQS